MEVITNPIRVRLGFAPGPPPPPTWHPMLGALMALPGAWHPVAGGPALPTKLSSLLDAAAPAKAAVDDAELAPHLRVVELLLRCTTPFIDGPERGKDGKWRRHSGGLCCVGGW